MTEKEWDELELLEAGNRDFYQEPRYQELIAKTRLLDEHPEDRECWCECWLCRSCIDD